jgi:DNA polymerase-3 subunit delta
VKLPPNRIDSFIRRPDPGIRAVLLYGPDAGAVRDYADTLARGVVNPPTDPFRVAELASAEIGRDPARLVDEVFALSLIGGRRLVRVRDASDAVAPALEAVLKGGETDTLVVLEADELTPRSALRKLAEGADGAAAIACYMPDEEAIGRFIHRLLAEAKVSADGEAEQLLAASLVGDRQIARREVEKLIAYVGEGGRVDLEAVRACIGDATERSLDDLAMAVADGDLPGLDRALNRLLSEGGEAIGILRAVQRHFLRLHQLAVMIDSGDAPDAAMAALRPPVFFKAKAAIRGQARRWNQGQIGEALRRLIEAEAECKRTGRPPDTVCAATLLRIARAVARKN